MRKIARTANNLSYFTRAMFFGWFGKTTEVTSKDASTAVVHDSAATAAAATAAAAAINKISEVLITAIKEIAETERVQQQEKTKRQKQKELTIRLCFAIFALCVLICFVAILMAR